MSEPVLVIDNVTKRYKKTVAINGFSMSVGVGELVGVVGAGGSGKSTLVNLLGGIVMPDSGDIVINGVSLYRDYEQCMGIVGIVPERPSFYSYMTGRANLRTLAAMYKNVKEPIIDELIRELELEPFIDQNVSSYSRSATAMLAIAVAFLCSPILLVFDGTLSELDSVALQRVKKLLKKVSIDHGVSAVITARRMSDIDKICDRVAVIDRGQMVGVGSIEKLRQANCNKRRHKMILDRPDEAAMYLNENAGVGVEVRGDVVIVDAEQSMIPKLLSMLFARGYLVYETAPLETALEDAYLRMLKNR